MNWPSTSDNVAVVIVMRAVVRTYVDNGIDHLLPAMVLPMSIALTFVIANTITITITMQPASPTPCPCNCVAALRSNPSSRKGCAY